jgi:hypothetical protein
MAKRSLCRELTDVVIIGRLYTSIGREAEKMDG